MKSETQIRILEMQSDRLKRDLASAQITLIHLALVMKDTVDWLEEAAKELKMPSFKEQADKLRKEIPK